MKSSSGEDAPKVKPSFQPPKQETFKVRPSEPKLESDSEMFTRELSCDIAESQPKKSTGSVKKSVTKKDVNKENIDPNSTTNSHVSSAKAKLLAHKEKTLTKPKLATKPKFIAPNVHNLTTVKDNMTHAIEHRDHPSGVAKKNKTFSIMKKPGNNKTDKRTNGTTTEKTTENSNKTNNKTKKKSENQDSAEKSGAKKTNSGSKTSEDATKKTLSQKRPVDDITDDLNIDLEDKLFPDLELTSASLDRRQGFDGDDDSEPFDVEPGNAALSEITGVGKLNSLRAGYDSDPMEFEE